MLNEVMYNPEGDENENEYIELYNNDITPINLSEWRVTDGGDTDRIAAFEQGLQVYPGQYILILDPDYFENGSTQYDGRIPEGALVVTIDNGAFGERGLSNSNAETVSILNDAGLCVAAYTYSLGNQSGYSDEKI
ncbi:MAG: lamin tail domain-containing protein, partial [Calditrichota bacterium]